MRTIRKSGITALTAAIALSLGAVPVALTVPAIVASGEEPTTLDAGAASVGKLVLSTTKSGGTVSFNGSTESFTGGQQCEITPAMDDESSELLNITGNVGDGPGTAGFRDGSIGVYEFDAESDGPENASQCFRVDADSFTEVESLTLRLDADLSDFVGPLIATAATATPVAQSRDGVLEITLIGADGEDVKTFDRVPWFRKKSGQAIPDLPLMTGRFYGIRLTAIEGSFSLAGAEAATFDVESEADGILDCGDSVSRSAEATSDDALRNVTITRLENAGSESGECAKIPYLFSKADNFTDFLKPLDQEVTAQFVFDFTWTVPADIDPSGDTADTALLPRTLVDFDGEASDSNDPVAIAWCPDLVEETITVNGQAETFMVVKDIGTNELAKDQADDYPAVDDPDTTTDEDTKQFACLVSQSSEVRPGEVPSKDVLTVEERIYVYGDIRLLRP